LKLPYCRNCRKKYFGENIPLLLLLGLIWAVIYAKVLADADRPEVPHYWVIKLGGSSIICFVS